MPEGLESARAIDPPGSDPPGGSARPGKGKPPARLGYMPALDGLRALAVIAVLLYHADIAWIPSGFLGVDVFFVISGYLITALLFAESRRTGTVDYRRFWFRRARRLLPALFAMLAVVALFAVVFLPDDVARLRGDLFASLLYVQNWWQIFHEQSYFIAAGRPPLLQHVWSLAVEEQFYLLWPVMFVGGMVLFRRRRSRMLLAILGGIALSTLLMAILFDPSGDPSRVYYGTDTRAAALLVGAALALVWPPWRLDAKTGRGARYVLDAIGIAAVVALGWIMANVTEFEPRLYRGGFLVVALLAGLIIAVTVHPVGGGLQWLLSRSWLRWVGVRSYAIYLWHWPVYMVTRPELDPIPLTGLPLLILRVTITVVLAEISYLLVESPVRRDALTEHLRRLRTTEGDEHRRALRVTLAAGGAATVAMLVIVIGFANAGPAPVPPGFESAQAVSTAKTNATTTTTAAVPATPIGDPNATTPTTVVAPALPVRAIGDSVMLGARASLEARMPGIVVDASVSRHFGETVGIATALRDSGQLGDVVVIHMGTNGVITDGEFDAMMEALKDVDRVVVLNVKVPRRWEGPDNATLDGAVKRWPNAVLVNWHGEGSAHPEWFWQDGYHLDGAGPAAYADLIAKAAGL